MTLYLIGNYRDYSNVKYFNLIQIFTDKVSAENMVSNYNVKREESKIGEVIVNKLMYQWTLDNPETPENRKENTKQYLKVRKKLEKKNNCDKYYPYLEIKEVKTETYLNLND